MIGLILWYNAEKSVGLVWCEDQGPLAYVGPEVEKPDGVQDLVRGSQVRFDFDEVNGFRTVRRIEGISVVMGAVDPAGILASYELPQPRPELRVVA